MKAAKPMTRDEIRAARERCNRHAGDAEPTPRDERIPAPTPDEIRERAATIRAETMAWMATARRIKNCGVAFTPKEIRIYKHPKGRP